ncbi:MAG: hypothetical protein M3321_01090 [Actinomycetota bacterium]|nr:hypothetical protein [Actinomycetota bacterium]
MVETTAARPVEAASPERRARWRPWVKGILLALIALDVVYPIIIFGSGQWWYDLMHGTDYVDPQGLLKRLGAVWATFALFQIIAFFRWEKAPHWLMLVAGLRFGEIVADWVYWSAADDRTWIGTLGLLSASPTNLVLGFFFYRAYFVFAGSRER